MAIRGLLWGVTLPEHDVIDEEMAERQAILEADGIPGAKERAWEIVTRRWQRLKGVPEQAWVPLRD